jgi:hypothetical protein
LGESVMSGVVVRNELPEYYPIYCRIEDDRF